MEKEFARSEKLSSKISSTGSAKLGGGCTGVNSHLIITYTYVVVFSLPIQYLIKTKSNEWYCSNKVFGILACKQIST